MLFSGEPAYWVVAPFAIAIALYFFLSGFRSRVELRPKERELTVVTAWRRRKIPLEQIGEVETLPIGGPELFETVAPVLTLVDGTEVTVAGQAGYARRGSNRRVEELVRTIRTAVG
jgi:hypothetical protein